MTGSSTRRRTSQGTVDLLEPDLVARYRYDGASRIAGIQVGESGEQVFQYDEKSRVARVTDGHEGQWGLRYDVWNRVFAESHPTGAFVQRKFDEAHNLTQTKVFAGDPSGPLLQQTETHVTSFGRMDDRTDKLTVEGQERTTVRVFDGARAFDTLDRLVDRLATLTWGSSLIDATPTATELPDQVWGQFGFGWRGMGRSDVRDGAKIGRQSMAEVLGSETSLHLFSSQGWAWRYDTGVRVRDALQGQGNLTGDTNGEGDERFYFRYGHGDEMGELVRQNVGEATKLTHGPNGRILSRNGEPFTHDAVGRRTEDDRFLYRWNWRGELKSVEVKSQWQADREGKPVTSPFAGNKVFYDYDARGRLTFRTHMGALPESETEDSERPFIEKREYVWEDQSLLVETAYGDPQGTQIRWRKTYVPGPQGLDDAVQVVVDVVDVPVGAVAGTRTYTYLRDELGTVLGLVAEDEGTDPTRPPVPVRYLYTPYGQVHVETSPELRYTEFDNEQVTVETLTTTASQTVVEPTTHAPGALRLRFAVPLDLAGATSGVIVERTISGTDWVAVGEAEVLVGTDSTPGTDPRDLVVLLRSGWSRGSFYRVRISAEVGDRFGRTLGQEQVVWWPIPENGPEGEPRSVGFFRLFDPEFESFEVAGDTVGGRFPGGQNSLFQGLWTDPVTGLSYARARWYDARNGNWLTEDPFLDVDSPNLYAFVGWQPNTGTDPLGLQNARMDAWAKSGFQFAQEHPEQAGHVNTTILGFLPVTGEALDAVEGFSGRSLATGEHLSDLDRFLTAGALGLPFVSGKLLRGARVGLRGLWNWVARSRNVADEVAEVVEQGVRHGQEVFSEGGLRVDDAGRVVDDLPESSVPRGRLVIDAGEFSASEIRSAEHLANLGRNVRLRQPIGTRAAGGTSDLLVDGVRYDVYTPRSANPNRIIGEIARKGSQVQGGGVVLDLSQTSVTAADLGDVLSRVQGITNQISDVIILPP